MRHLSKFLALVLAALWLPVTQHCSLEAAGVLSWQCATDCESGGADFADGCVTVEKAPSKVAAGRVEAQAPVLFACLGLRDPVFSSLLAESDIADSQAASFERPGNWVPIWSFSRRAAPPSRAPTVLCA